MLASAPDQTVPTTLRPSTFSAVLFVCAPDGNRAVMAAALARHHGPRTLHVSWAHGQLPQVHPYALVALSERGLSAEGLDEYLLGAAHPGFDLIVDLVQEREPSFVGQCPPGQVLHRPARPPQFGAGHAALQMFRYVRDELEHIVVQLLEAPR